MGVLLTIAGCSVGFILLTSERSIADLKKENARNSRINEELEKTIRESKSQLDRITRSDVSKSEFVAMITHELRNPIATIMATVEVLGETKLTSEQREYVETLHRSSEALFSLTGDAMDLSRIEAGHLTIESYQFDLYTSVESVIQAFTPVARGKGLDLVLEFPEDAPRRVVGDASRIRQVITNLVGNALKFTSAGYVRIAVTGRRLDPKTAMVQVSVTDSGIGIAPDRLGSLFEKFVRPAKSASGLHKGTGMGLVISRKLIELMGGRIRVESEPGKGSRFWFELPLTLAPEDRLRQDPQR
jgi:signal transduction histidine kinase